MKNKGERREERRREERERGRGGEKREGKRQRRARAVQTNRHTMPGNKRNRRRHTAGNRITRTARPCPNLNWTQ